MYLTGFTDEASKRIDVQIKALHELGWSNMECRETEYGNIAAMTDTQFNECAQKLSAGNIRINCYGSAIANWKRSIFDDPESSYNELRTAIPRLHTLGTTMVRVMSFQCPEDASINTPDIEREVIKRMKVLTAMAEDGGVTLVHENCNNWGGRSWEHTLRILDAIQSPALRLVFDTGNPVFRKDVRFDGSEPFPYQRSWDFFSHVEEFVEYVHIKDGTMEGDSMRFTHAGEGDGDVVKILNRLHERGYDGGISIEPHLAVVFHDETVQNEEQVMYDNFIEYGRRVQQLVREAGWSV